MSDLYDLIKKFPEHSELGITLIVYDDSHIAEAGYEIALHWGVEYLNQNVTIVSYKENPDYKPIGDVYIDPMVLKYKAQWQD